MVFTLLLALSGLTLSAVAIYYSVIGLTAIFAAAFWPIVVMGTSLEVSKLVAASWLKANWERIPKFMKIYMMLAVIILMLITSMGIFGFLSKAHSDQNLVSGDVQSKISVYDEKIKTAKENIDANRKALKQMDDAVDQVMGRSNDEKGADKAVAIRKGQAKERSRLQAEIASEQKLISQLNDEAAPIRAEIRKVEAEVGPIKYIAKFVYGDNPDENILEKAVTWVIMIIIFVFDPMAVLLLLASQMTWAWYKEQNKESTPTQTFENTESPTEEEKDWIDQQEEELNEAFNDVTIEEPTEPVIPAFLLKKEEEPKPRVDPHPIGWAFPKRANIVDYKVAEDADDELDLPVLENEEMWAQRVIDENDIVADAGGVEAWNKLLEEAERAVEEEKSAYQTMIDQIPVEGTKGQRYRVIKGGEDILFEFDGEKWVGVENQSIERPGDYLTPPDDEESKKKNYIVKEHNQQIRKTTS